MSPAVVISVPPSFNLPLAGKTAIVYVKLVSLGSGSTATNVIVPVSVSSFVDSVWSWATGGSLSVLLTVIDTVAASTLFSTSVNSSSPTPLSLALNLNESEPAKLELGV